jgi:hypothetical protein
MNNKSTKFSSISGVSRVPIILLASISLLIALAGIFFIELQIKTKRMNDEIINSSIKPKLKAIILSERGKEAYELLLRAKKFEDKYIGYGEVPSERVLAFQYLLQEPYADAAFKSLLEKAKIPGQLYALCGIYFTDPEFFSTAVERYRNNDEYILTIIYCVISKNKVSDIVELKSGNCNVSKEIIIENGIKKEIFIDDGVIYDSKGKAIDIFNGGIPNRFKSKY